MVNQETDQNHMDGTSLFGRPISSQFHIFLVDQFFFWSTKNQFLIFLVDQFFFWSTKNHFLMFLVDQETDQKHMDAADVPKICGYVHPLHPF